jgi:hypothetical protein
MTRTARMKEIKIAHPVAAEDAMESKRFLFPSRLGPEFPDLVPGFDSHETAVIQGQNLVAVGWLPADRGADHEEVGEGAALCSAKDSAQDQDQAPAREVGHSRGATSRGRDGPATCGAVNEAPSYGVTETPFG